MLSLDWKSYIAAQNELGNKNTAMYIKAWFPHNDDQKRFQALISDADNILLATDYNKKIHALHSFKVTGGTRLCPTTKLMNLLGTGVNASALLVNKPKFSNLCNVVTLS
jgi:hypothetical protein